MVETGDVIKDGEDAWTRGGRNSTAEEKGKVMCHAEIPARKNDMLATLALVSDYLEGERNPDDDITHAKSLRDIMEELKNRSKFVHEVSTAIRNAGTGMAYLIPLDRGWSVISRSILNNMPINEVIESFDSKDSNA